MEHRPVACALSAFCCRSPAECIFAGRADCEVCVPVPFPHGYRFTALSLQRFGITILTPRLKKSGRRLPHSKSWRIFEPAFKIREAFWSAPAPLALWNQNARRMR